MQNLILRGVLVFVCLFQLAWTEEEVVRYPPLFASVEGIEANDTLNVRAKATYRSQKVATLPLHALVGVDQCMQKGLSVWCKIHHMAQYDYEGYGYEAPEGWVNAKYLHFSNRGYVLIDNKGECDYVLGCEGGMCRRVIAYETDKTFAITAFKTQKIARSRLRGESHFGAMSPEGDGYCTVGAKITDYQIDTALQKQKGFSSSPAYQNALNFLQLFNPEWPENIIKFIDPKRGLRVGYHTYFTKRDKEVSCSEIATMERDRMRRYRWGKEVNEKEVEMSLYALLYLLKPDLTKFKEVRTLPSLRGFPCEKGEQCKGFVFYFYEKPREVDLSWTGLIVIMRKRGTTWYVAGILRDRWTI